MFDFDIWRFFGVTLGYRLDGVFSSFEIYTDTSESSNDPICVTPGAPNCFNAKVGYVDHRFYASLNLRY